jgi:short-subunit dehydrogenase
MTMPLKRTIRTALVTGASSGIGLELSRLLARDGARVVMVARDDERLRRAARWVQAENPGAGVTTIAADLSRPGAAAELDARARREVDPIDLLVNNAGVGTFGPFAAATADSQIDMLRLNMESVVALTRLTLPDMMARRQGAILNVASMAAFQAGPFMAVYYATKAFVLSFSEALAEELHESGVTVTALCPGPAVTGFGSRAGMEGSRVFSGWLRMEAGAIAAEGYRGALEGRRIVIPGFTNRVLVQALRLLPRRLVSRIVRQVNTPGSPATATGEGGSKS